LYIQSNGIGVIGRGADTTFCQSAGTGSVCKAAAQALQAENQKIFEEKKIARTAEVSNAFNGEPARDSIGSSSHTISLSGDWPFLDRH
jgi:hypothetical protein